MTDPAPNRRCSALNKLGEPCKAAALRGSNLCSVHDPKSPTAVQFGPGHPPNGAGRKPNPRVVDVMRERVEANIDAVLAPYFRALERAKLHASYEGNVIVSPHDDLGAMIAAGEKLLDRVYGKPKQVSELSGPDGGPLSLEQVLFAAPVEDDE